MHSENGLLVDLPGIGEVVRKADVFAVSFRLFPERLLIDTRYDPDDASGRCALPMVAIVDPVASVQERYFWLGQHRPALGTPEAFMFFHWPHSVDYLEESGVWRAVHDRIAGGAFAGAQETCDAALRELREREGSATDDAIRGERHHTIWQRES